MPWEDKPEWAEIRYRVRNPDDFQDGSFRRIPFKKSTPKVVAIIGKLKGEDSTTVQSLRFPKGEPDNWTLAKAKDWVKNHFKKAMEDYMETCSAELREVKHIEIEIKEATDLGIFDGTASLYGQRDLGGDLIEKGAFTKTIAENPVIPILWQHDSREVIGTGQLKDSPSGLKIHGELDMQDGLAVKALRKIKNGLIRGLSIGFQALKWDYQQEEDQSWPTRIIKEVKLWEVSIVTFPMLPAAQIISAKDFEAEARNLVSMIAEAKTGRQLSNASISKIRAAIEELTALLEEAGAEEATTSKEAAGTLAEPVRDHSEVQDLAILASIFEKATEVINGT
jgi:hypothetical protein